MKTPHRDWAIEKVRTLSPATKEKATLLAIARYADSDGSSCYPGIAKIAFDCGKSKRTVKRHIKTLEERGELMVERQGKKGLRTNVYYISVCRLTAEEREAITGISRRQMKLPIQQPQELSDNKVSERGLEILKDENPKLYEELMKATQGLTMSDALHSGGRSARERFFGKE